MSFNNADLTNHTSANNEKRYLGLWLRLLWYAEWNCSSTLTRRSVLTENTHFEMYPKANQLIRIFSKGGITPIRPGTKTLPVGIEVLNSPLLTLVEACWSRDPNQRPTAKEVHQHLVALDIGDRPSQDTELAMFVAPKGTLRLAIDACFLFSSE